MFQENYKTLIHQRKMKIINTLLGKSDSDLKLKKEPTGEWVVKKGTTVLYIGSKDKCQIYMTHVN